MDFGSNLILIHIKDNDILGEIENATEQCSFPDLKCSLNELKSNSDVKSIEIWHYNDRSNVKLKLKHSKIRQNGKLIYSWSQNRSVKDFIKNNSLQFLTDLARTDNIVEQLRLWLKIGVSTLIQHLGKKFIYNSWEIFVERYGLTKDVQGKLCGFGDKSPSKELTFLALSWLQCLNKLNLLDNKMVVEYDDLQNI